ncbi:hypothetical protein PENSPDRAFT_87821 [Peniophora sp. CONT]|nr:hypothetical protein PENSPDRAFT_87821 [Peniophora sp. CONT]
MMSPTSGPSTDIYGECLSAVSPARAVHRLRYSLFLPSRSVRCACTGASLCYSPSPPPYQIDLSHTPIHKMADVIPGLGIPLSQLPSVYETIGCLYIGWGASALVTGMLCLQTWTYFNRYPQDPWGYKLLVASLMVMETVHEVFVGHVGWFYGIENFGNPLTLLDKPVWTLSTQVLLGAFVGTVVKICFALRVWKFSKKGVLITGLIMGMAFAQLGLAAAYTVRSTSLRLVEAAEIKTLATTGLALGCATDIVTALSLSYFLHKMRTGYAASDSLITRLIVYSVNTGAITSLCSLAVVITYNLMSTNFVFMACYFVLSKLYANSCLATLNTRKFIRGRGTDNNHNTGPSFAMVNRTGNESKINRNDSTALRVGIQQDVSIISDDGRRKRSARRTMSRTATMTTNRPSTRRLASHRCMPMHGDRCPPFNAYSVRWRMHCLQTDITVFVQLDGHSLRFASSESFTFLPHPSRPLVPLPHPFISLLFSTH